MELSWIIIEFHYVVGCAWELFYLNKVKSLISVFKIREGLMIWPKKWVIMKIRKSSRRGSRRHLLQWFYLLMFFLLQQLVPCAKVSHLPRRSPSYDLENITSSIFSFTCLLNHTTICNIFYMSYFMNISVINFSFIMVIIPFLIWGTVESHPNSVR